jgi:hypothetical protein
MAAWRVVTQERSPSLGWWPPSFDHVLGDARFCDLKPELEQFAVDAWRTPKRILPAHSTDQDAQLRVDLRSSSKWARLPIPVAAKSGSVPTDERLGPDNCDSLQDRWKPAIQLDEEQAVMVGKLYATTKFQAKGIEITMALNDNKSELQQLLADDAPESVIVEKLQVIVTAISHLRE